MPADRVVHPWAKDPRTLRSGKRLDVRALAEVRPEPALSPSRSLWRDPKP